MEESVKLDEYIHNFSAQEDDLLADLRRQTNLKIRHPRMLSGIIQGKFLEMIASMINPKNVLEIGTYTGYSAICIARGLKDSAKLYTIEINDELRDFAEVFFQNSGEASKITQIVGDALEVIPKLDCVFDLVFIDGEKDEYCKYFNLIIEKLRPGGFILADNVLWSGKVIQEKIASNDYFTKGILEFNQMIKNDKRVENVIIPFRDGINIIRKN
ncbi:MAG: O-methyltransferase [Bacteroidales bacterium]|nr:O-methyltransferase [Bacteroidales bacterium]